MVKLSNILYPSDFSEFSVCALPYAVSLAAKFDATMHLLHVVDNAYQYWLGLGDSAMPAAIPAEDIWIASEKQMAGFIEKHLSEQKDRLLSKMVAGSPFVEIVRYAQDNAIDMIVIGAHGRSGLASMLLGGVTEKVVRKAPCPVLTVRHPKYKFEMP